MTVVIPAPSVAMRMTLAEEAVTTGVPVPLLQFRHVPVNADAVVLSVVGMTADNLVAGFAIGRVDDDEPRRIVVVGEPRDPALSVRAGAALADILDPFVRRAAAGGPMPQILVDGPNTLDAVMGWAWRLRQPWLPGPYADDPELVALADRCQDAYALLRALTGVAKIPDTDVIVTAVDALTGHLVFPLAG
ncbi:hypothetical protein [Actinoplanes sp. NPDC020271]|uniref:hypothetical protein n=1 Tax=Actinoplanes sp. NPDC020271 TaxID=3363896 RepID=UPI0037B2FA26